MKPSTLALLPLLFAARLTFTEEPRLRLDREGVPLPAEAVQRIGSTKLLMLGKARFVSISKDGKRLYSVSQSENPGVIGAPICAVTAWNIELRSKIWEWNSPEFEPCEFRFESGEKHCFLVGLDKVRDRKQPLTRVVLNTESGRENDRQTILFHGTQAVAQHPNGNLAYGRFDEKANDISMPILDATGKEIARFEPEDQLVESIAWAPDGKSLYVAGRTFDQNNSVLSSVDAATGKKIWRVPSGPQLAAPLVSSDGKILYSTRAGAKRDFRFARSGFNSEYLQIVRWDAKTGREIESLDIPEEPFRKAKLVDYFHPSQMVFDPKGHQLLYQTYFDDKTIAIDLKTWKTGKVEGNPSGFGWFHPSGESYFAPRGSNLVEYVAATHTPKPAELSDPLSVRQFHQLKFSADDKRLERGESGVASEVWNIRTGGIEVRNAEKEGDRLYPKEIRDPRNLLAMSPIWKLTRREIVQGNRVIELIHELSSPLGDDQPIRLPGKVTYSERFAFSQNGEYLISNGESGEIRIWHLKSKLENPRVLGVEKPAAAMGKKPSGEKAVTPNADDPFNRCAAIAVSMDDRQNRTSSHSRKWAISLVRFESADRIFQADGNGDLIDVKFLPNGRVFAVNRGDTDTYYRTSRNLILGMGSESFLLIDPDSGELLRREYPKGFGSYAVSPDGRMIAVGTSKDIEIIETLTGEVRHIFKGLERPAMALAFSGDGKLLASESDDGPILIWNVRGEASKVIDFEKALADLKGDPVAAFDATRQFWHHPKEGFKRISAEIAERKAPSKVELQKRIDALASPNFAEREKATKELIAFGMLAAAPLKKALEGELTDEQVQRLQRVLNAKQSADRRYWERIIEVLDGMKTNESKALLKRLGSGDGADPLTGMARKLSGR